MKITVHFLDSKSNRIPLCATQPWEAGGTASSEATEVTCKDCQGKMAEWVRTRLAGSPKVNEAEQWHPYSRDDRMPRR